jgi:hypothetical protein
MGRPRSDHHIWRRPERRLALAELQGQIRGRDPHRAHLLRHARQADSREEAGAHAPRGTECCSWWTTTKHAREAPTASFRSHGRVAVSHEHTGTAWAARSESGPPRAGLPSPSAAERAQTSAAAANEPTGGHSHAQASTGRVTTERHPGVEQYHAPAPASTAAARASRPIHASQPEIVPHQRLAAKCREL